MARTTKIRVKQDGDATLILVLARHPMETGRRIDKLTQAKIPAHHIQKMTFYVNDIEVAATNLGIAVSKDPLVGIKVKKLKKGAKVEVKWSDNQGERGSAETII